MVACAESWLPEAVDALWHDDSGHASTWDGRDTDATAMIVARRMGTVEQGEAIFTGYIADNETGLLHARARQYSPTLGRFIGRDPAGHIDGMGLYGAYYVPNHLDPYGLFLDDWWGGIDWGWVFDQIQIILLGEKPEFGVEFKTFPLGGSCCCDGVEGIKVKQVFGPKVRMFGLDVSGFGEVNGCMTGDTVGCKGKGCADVQGTLDVTSAVVRRIPLVGGYLSGLSSRIIQVKIGVKTKWCLDSGWEGISIGASIRVGPFTGSVGII